MIALLKCKQYNYADNTPIIKRENCSFAHRQVFKIYVLKITHLCVLDLQVRQENLMHDVTTRTSKKAAKKRYSRCRSHSVPVLRVADQASQRRTNRLQTPLFEVSYVKTEHRPSTVKNRESVPLVVQELMPVNVLSGLDDYCLETPDKQALSFLHVNDEENNAAQNRPTLTKTFLTHRLAMEWIERHTRTGRINNPNVSEYSMTMRERRLFSSTDRASSLNRPPRTGPIKIGFNRLVGNKIP